MKRFENMTLDKSVSLIIQDAERLLKFDSLMMLEIVEKDDFKYNSGSGENVQYKLSTCNKVAPVYFYKPFNPFTKAIGYSDGKAIHLNSRVFKNLVHADAVGLLLHEYCHIAGFGHGNNYKTKEKCLASVPYFASENIGKWI